MDYTLYFESTPLGEDAQNEYQFDRRHNVNSWLDLMLYSDQIMDKNGRLICTSDHKIEFINKFLDYHFSQYSGDPEQFFLCLKDVVISMNQRGRKPDPNSIAGMIDKMSRQSEHCERLDRLYSPIIEAWIEKAKTTKHYTVKSVILACFYLRKKDIYLVPELEGENVIYSEVKRSLSEKFGLSYNSIHQDWNPIFTQKDKRISKGMTENIKGAIKLMQTISHPKINEAIDFARRELNETELSK